MDRVDMADREEDAADREDRADRVAVDLEGREAPEALWGRADRMGRTMGGIDRPRPIDGAVWGA